MCLHLNCSTYNMDFECMVRKTVNPKACAFPPSCGVYISYSGYILQLSWLKGMVHPKMLKIYTSSGHPRWRWVSFFLQQIWRCFVTSLAQQWMGAVRMRVQTADKNITIILSNYCVIEQLFTSQDSNWCYCDVFISCLDSHSDGTHSLQRIYCQLNAKSLQICSDEEINLSTSRIAWGWVTFGWTIPWINAFS